MTKHPYLLWRQREAECNRGLWATDFPNSSGIEEALEGGDTLERFQENSVVRDFRRDVLKRCTSDYGFVLLQGFPLALSALDVTKRRFAEFGKMIGATLSQDSRGEHLGELSAQTRGADWYNDLPFHTDGAHLLLLLGVQPARTGGLTKLACAAAVLETMQIERPNTWQILFEPWAFHRGSRPGPAYFERAIFKGRVNSTPDCFFLPGTIRKTPAVTGVPLSSERLQALEQYEGIAEREDHHLRLSLSPGDVLIVNNNKVLHGRTRYADEPGALPRLVLRMWVNADDVEFR